MTLFDSLIRPHLLKFAPYRSARDEAKQGKIWLNANESPWNDQQNELFLNRYPEKQPALLRQRLAEIWEVNPNSLLITRGSDEGIDLLIRLCCDEKLGILICPPTFGMYKVCAELLNSPVYSIPLSEDTGFQINVSELAHNAKDSKIIFLCSPNNPTGNIILTTSVLNLCQQCPEKLVVVDEAYIDYSLSHSVLSYLIEYPNLVILRTMSKAYGLAGARIGAVIAHPELISWLSKIIAPYPIPKLSALAVLEQLTPEALLKQREKIEIIINERTKLTAMLKQFSFIKKVYPSEANFILIRVNDEAALMSFLVNQEIVLRSMSHQPQLKNCIRLSIGTPTENKALIQALVKFNK